jgi:hypothetical protein
MSQTKGGRPSTDLQTRLSQMLGHWPDLTSWPNKATPCWPGPRLIWSGETMMSTPRACLSLILQQPIHSSHRVSHQGTRGPFLFCEPVEPDGEAPSILGDTPSGSRVEVRGPATIISNPSLPRGWVPCINPHHYKLEIIPSDPDAVPLPWQVQALATPPSRQQDVTECADTIAAMELRDKTPQEVFDAVGGVYDLDIINEALIEAQEL